MDAFFSKWVRICLFNLLIVALLGSLMRYKIAYSLPWLPQKNILNAHSHFAFAGWLSQILMVLMVQYLGHQLDAAAIKKYNNLLKANLFAAWGMLFSFPLEGYGLVSIIFSTLSIFVSYAFAIVYWRDLNRQPSRRVAHLWFKAGLLWNAVSSIGPFALAYMMATGMRHEHGYLAAIYFFLHFQYNGWFFFACAGLLYRGNEDRSSSARFIFYLMSFACLPAYFLSVLWAKLPSGAYGAAILAALAQLIAWAALLSQFYQKRITLLAGVTKTVRILLLFAAAAASIKFVLQAGSLHPELATLAFGFRPIVIGYLHLVLLGMITIFIIGYLKHTGLVPSGGLRRPGMIIFVSGIVVQEILLLAQGMLAIGYHGLPYINEALFASALMMLCGIVLLNLGMRRARGPEPRLSESGIMR